MKVETYRLEFLHNTPLSDYEMMRSAVRKVRRIQLEDTDVSEISIGFFDLGGIRVFIGSNSDPEELLEKFHEAKRIISAIHSSNGFITVGTHEVLLALAT